MTGSGVTRDTLKSQDHDGVRTSSEAARMARFWAELERPRTGNLYDLSEPPPEFVLNARPEQSELERLRAAWHQAKANAAALCTPIEQRHFTWLGIKLSEALRRTSSPTQASSVLKSTLQFLDDFGHRHLVRCQLAIAAAAAGDILRSQGWLAKCDAAPEFIELDSAYREARARLSLAMHDYTEVLKAAGAYAGEVPLHPSYQYSLSRMRAVALEAISARG